MDGMLRALDGLLIVGGQDHQVLKPCASCRERRTCSKSRVLLEQVVETARQWCDDRLRSVPVAAREEE
ncbi:MULTISPECIES: hypothetical protein [Streptomyces]|uniref:hypothetical protein n=1 Tax=Streptomyces TaxID=1883 RepID=UPI001E2FCCD2|nr:MULTISPECIES: hypothetical protein [Streptomyces]